MRAPEGGRIETIRESAIGICGTCGACYTRWGRVGTGPIIDRSEPHESWCPHNEIGPPKGPDGLEDVEGV